MQKDLLYCAIDVSKDKLDLDAAALALPAQLGNDQAGFRQLIKAAKKGGRQQPLRETNDTFLQNKRSPRARAGLAQQIRHYDRNSLASRQFDVGFGTPSENMEDVSRLLRVPKSKVFHFHPNIFQRRFGLLDLNLKSSVSQEKGQMMIDEDFHSRRRLLKRLFLHNQHPSQRSDRCGFSGGNAATWAWKGNLTWRLVWRLQNISIRNMPRVLLLHS